MLLTLDIGNTEITAGLYRGDALAAHWRLMSAAERTPDEWAAALHAQLLRRGLDAVALRAACVGSVAPAITRALLDGVAALAPVTPLLVDARSPLPLALDVDEPLTVGADRIINALAAVTLVQGDAIVVDFGTATTFDCVTADRRFIGGIIMPGLRTAADQLVRRAAKLTATELEPPARAIGRRTEECLRAGLLFGTADAVDGLIARITAEWPGGGTPAVLATGGLAGTIAPLTQRIRRVEPTLTLDGLRLAATHLGLRW